jgi:hypothetical protein
MTPPGPARGQRQRARGLRARGRLRLGPSLSKAPSPRALSDRGAEIRTRNLQSPSSPRRWPRWAWPRNTTGTTTTPPTTTVPESRRFGITLDNPSGPYDPLGYHVGLVLMRLPVLLARRRHRPRRTTRRTTRTVAPVVQYFAAAPPDRTNRRPGSGTATMSGGDRSPQAG